MKIEMISFLLIFLKISVPQLILVNQNGPDKWSHFCSKVAQSLEWQIVLSQSHC